jgi:hypothetical protein
MAGPCTTNHQRAFSQPEQRQFVKVEQQQRQHKGQRGALNTSHAGTTEGLGDPIERFEIYKSTPLGLVFPQNVHFSLRNVHETSPDYPVFTTSELKWWQQGFMIPPSFKIFRGAPVHVEEDAQEPYPVAEIKYCGWQGVTSMSISLTVYNITPAMHYQHDTEGANTRSQYTVSRPRWLREYVISLSDCKWRSPSTQEKITMPLLSAGGSSQNDDASGTEAGHGNLILEDANGRIIAIYRQRRDFDILGSLAVFAQEQHSEPKITTEAIVASCLAVVVYERVGWQNLLGN